MPTLTREDVIRRRKLAARQATNTGKVPKNKAANVPPAQAPRKIEPLGRKVRFAEPVPDDDGDDGDSPSPVRKLSKEERRAQKRSKVRAEAADMSKTARAQPTTRAIAPRGLVDPTREITTMDVVIPRLKISQAMSKVNTDGQVAMGNWYRSPSNKNMGKELLVIVADMQKSRSYFVQGQGVLCRSYDMVMGEGDPGMPCEGSPEERSDPTLSAEERGCPLRLWGDRDPSTGYSTPPDCGINFNYKLLILNDKDPMEGPTVRGFWSLRSTATKIARQINTILQESEGEWFSMILKIGVQQTNNRRGTYYLPTVEFYGKATGTALKKGRRFAEQMIGVSIRATLESDIED